MAPDSTRCLLPDSTDRAKTAFVLDDDPQVGALVCRLAKSLGIAARQFAEPGRFLAELRDHAPDLVFLDLALEEADAVDVIRQLAALNYKGSILLISGRDYESLVEIERIGRSRGLAMLPPLQKPFRVADLQRSLAQQPVGLPLCIGDGARPPAADASQVSLKESLERDWLEVWYQPKLDLKSLTVAGAEALVRARHPERGIIAPRDLLPPAGDPLYQPLSSFVLRRALADWTRFADQGVPLKLAVNIPISVLEAPGFINLIRQLLPENPRFPGLIVEVTEDEAGRDSDWMHEIAAQLRLCNVSLSIDDFGSAYASLARVRDVPFVELKLDRSFVANCSVNPVTRGVCATVADLAHRFKASLCAEGVETSEDLRCLIELGCDTAQGYLFAKPMPCDAFVQWLAATAPGAVDGGCPPLRHATAG
jgi:EAL domain-containing protein (putative c-di-GMP-specific phosphodiesterase class I)/ActR/RegA family two-component response regulator